MAHNALATELTRAHRTGQIEVGARTAATVGLLGSLLDINDLDGSYPLWAAAVASAVAGGYQESQVLASGYVEAFRDAEIGRQPGPIVTPVMRTQEVLTDLRIKGPVRVKTLLGSGVAAEVALTRGIAASEGAAIRQALAGGRRTVYQSAIADPEAGKWRRVTDGEPCAFCGMLAGRGPVYRSRETAGADRDWHDYCGCTAEIFYGEWDDWIPNELETELLQSYVEAAQVADTVEGVRLAPTAHSDGRDTILRRMRRNNPELFNDGVRPRD